ncbi:MAG TPA: cation diffusion facilitator family transporter [Burkholderiales bacterium]|nr:cation diffusion facilitator family transporter [Burkholderiales bacterium]
MTAMAHAHHDHPKHPHPHPPPFAAALWWSLLITIVFALIELAGGLWSGSLALLSDAGHMFSDAVALALAAFAQWIGRQPASGRHTYGLARAEVIAALVNGLAMLAVIVLIVVEAVERLRAPVPVAGAGVIAIALAGLLANLLVFVIVSRGESSLNLRAALVHVTGDILGSVAALIAGAVIYFTGWMPIDPILSLVIAALILFSTLHLLRETVHVLMEGVPYGIELDAVARALGGIAGFDAVHDLHVWHITPEQIALSAHVEVSSLSDWPPLLETARIMLHSRFAIDHVTLQPEVREWLKQPYQADVRIVPRRD